MAATFSFETTEIDGLLVLTMKEGVDDRGVVREFFRTSAWADAGLPELGPWRQLNVTESKRGAIRGLHGEAMTKLVAVVAGEGFGVYVDTRPESPTFGAIVTVPLVSGRQVLVPKGVCNGYQSVTDTQYVYCFDDEWRPGMSGIAVNPLDPALGIEWPVPVDVHDRSQVSEKDANLPSFAEATQTAAK
ncbi:MAG TPA: dTDP-4-dehydrorhamnose 3,5-epimerase [Acidimicrobiales bacterium]|nr:dTDP-4-dehydrorhamnose 3,5-epimerase [Acidimicrobiales bacterium]